MNVKPILVYYGVKDEDVNKLISECFRDKVESISLKLDNHESKLLGLFHVLFRTYFRKFQ